MLGVPPETPSPSGPSQTQQEAESLSLAPRRHPSGKARPSGHSMCGQSSLCVLGGMRQTNPKGPKAAVLMHFMYLKPFY